MGGTGPLFAIGPDEWRACAVSEIAVTTFAVFVADAFTSSGTLVCPTRLPDTEVVNVIDGEDASAPGARVENVKVPMPEAPGARFASAGSVSGPKSTV